MFFCKYIKSILKNILLMMLIVETLMLKNIKTYFYTIEQYNANRTTSKLLMHKSKHWLRFVIIWKMVK